jgi:hypothetical protein
MIHVDQRGVSQTITPAGEQSERTCWPSTRTRNWRQATIVNVGAARLRITGSRYKATPWAVSISYRLDGTHHDHADDGPRPVSGERFAGHTHFEPTAQVTIALGDCESATEAATSTATVPRVVFPANASVCHRVQCSQWMN